MNIKELLNKKIIISDGGMGTMLQAAGLGIGQIPESYNITHPEIVSDIHRQYIAAGSNIITANTFGASPIKLEGTGFTCDEIFGSALKCAKNAAGNNAFVAADIGPLGELLQPIGSLSQADAYESFKTQAVLAEKYGADLVIIETMTDLKEAKTACLAVRENTNLPIICTMSFEENGRTFTGCTPSAAALTLSPLADVIGVNCSVGPRQLYGIISEFMEFTTVPVAASPNAGLPVMENGEVKYDIDSVQFADAMEKLVNLGVSVIGGCCGTTPEHIKRISDKFSGKTPSVTEFNPKCAVCTAAKTVVIDRTRVIGERINPTGKKRFKQALVENDMSYILEQAVSQINAGADILDVNTGLPEIDETAMLTSVVNEITAVTDTPLQIDSSSPSAVEAALRAYTGKAIVNSVNGEEKSINNILPLVKKYGAAVVILTLDENGIPKKAQQRFEIAEKVIKKALSMGIKKSDLFVDCLTLTVSAQQEDAGETLKAVRMVKERLGVKTVLGVSNISFGLPSRQNINETFLAQALFAGLDLPIINPNAEGMMRQVICHNVLANIDINAEKYIKKYADAKTEIVAAKTDMSLFDIVVNGYKDKAYEATAELLKTTDGLSIVDNYLIPALDAVGEKYEKGTLFLPQLIRAAETVKMAFERIKEGFDSDNKINKGSIVIATVKGDIHDIGKNIVKVILENYGFNVIDLGRDVAPELILDAVVKNNITLVGLSALMTTTVKSMEQTIQILKQHCPNVEVMVGGAVLTPEYADMIGADYYSRDAKMSVEIAKKHFNC